MIRTATTLAVFITLAALAPVSAEAQAATLEIGPDPAPAVTDRVEAGVGPVLIHRFGQARLSVVRDRALMPVPQDRRPAWFYPAVGAGIGGLIGGAVMGYELATGGVNFLPYHTLAFGVALGAVPGAAVGWLLTPTP